MTELNRLSAAEAARKIAAGEISAAALMEACLARIAAREPDVRAFAAFDPDLAMAAVKSADRAEPKGPLHGVPFAVKDIIDSADFPTSWGSKIYEGFRPGRDASCVQLLKDAGAILIGKTTTTEFARSQPTVTANPHNLRHTPGGSSSGSAAAVADFMVPLALGTQTAGSVVRPGAFCGVPAYKPSFAAFDLAGVMPCSSSLDTLGGFARSVEDFFLLRRALCPRSGETAPEPARPPRVALFCGPDWERAGPAVRQGCERAMAVLADAGASCGELATPGGFAEIVPVQKTIMDYETARARIHEYRAHRDRIGPVTASVIEDGLRIGHADYQAALRAAERLRIANAALLSGIDLALTPAAVGEAPADRDTTGDPLFCRPWTLLGLPAMSLPFGFGPAGMPLAIQLVGRRNGDEDFLHAALWVEASLSAA